MVKRGFPCHASTFRCGRKICIKTSEELRFVCLVYACSSLSLLATVSCFGHLVQHVEFPHYLGTAQSCAKCTILRECSEDVPNTVVWIGLNVKLRYQLLMYFNKLCTIPFINFVLPAWRWPYWVETCCHFNVYTVLYLCLMVRNSLLQSTERDDEKKGGISFNQFSKRTYLTQAEN